MASKVNEAEGREGEGSRTYKVPNVKHNNVTEQRHKYLALHGNLTLQVYSLSSTRPFLTLAIFENPGGN